MIALLLACTRALDHGASAVLGAAKDGTTGANAGDAIVRNAGATKGAAGRAAATGGAVYGGTATDGAAASSHATGRAAFVATDGFAWGGAVAAGVSTAGTAAVGPEVGDWNNSMGFTVPGCRRLIWRRCGKVLGPPCKMMVSSASRRCSCWRRWSSRASLLLSSTILWTSSYSPILVASSSAALAAALTADMGDRKSVV